METSEVPHPSAQLCEKEGLEYWQWNHPETGVLQIELTGKGMLTREEVGARAGEFMTPKDYVLLADRDMDIYRPRPDSALDMLGGGQDVPQDRLVVTFRKGVFPLEECRSYREALRGAAQVSRNRGNAAGELDMEALKKELGDRLIVESKTRASYYTIDGLRSATHISNVVHSGIIGYFNSTPRNPYCRLTSYTRDFPEQFQKATEFVRMVDKQFQRLIPKKWAAQREFIHHHQLEEKGWSVVGTAFSTMTVNRNYRTGLHLDDGDLPQGFGNLTVFEGDGPGYDGGHTVFPQFRIAADIRMGDFIGMDVHEWHGNTAMSPREPGDTTWERISLVCYCRELLQKCASREEEDAKRAQWEGSIHNDSHGKHIYLKEQSNRRAEELEEFLGAMAGPKA